MARFALSIISSTLSGISIDFAKSIPLTARWHQPHMHTYLWAGAGIMWRKLLPIFCTFIIFTLFYHANRRSRSWLPWCMGPMSQYSQFSILHSLFPLHRLNSILYTQHSIFCTLCSNPDSLGLGCNAYSIASSHYASGHKSVAKKWWRRRLLRSKKWFPLFPRSTSNATRQ